MNIRKKYIAMVILAVFTLCLMGWITLIAHGQLDNTATLSYRKEAVSKGLYIGKGYSLNSDKEKELTDDKEKKYGANENTSGGENSPEKDAKIQDTPSSVIERNLAKENRNSGSNSESGNKIRADGGNPNSSTTSTTNSNPNKPNKPNQQDNVRPNPDEDKLPIIETNLVNGNTYPNCFVAFNIKAEDYKGQLLGGYYGSLRVLVNGIEDTGAPKKDSHGNLISRNYNVDLNKGANSVEITAMDEVGRSRKLSFTIYGGDAEDIPEEKRKYAYISINLSNLGLPNKYPVTAMEITNGEIAIRFVKRYLVSIGMKYRIDGDPYGSYLNGMGQPGFVRGAKLTQEQLANIRKDTSLVAGVVDGEGNILLANYDWLAEKNITSGAGWMWKLNGIPPQYAMSDQEIYDGDEIELFWTNNLGWDAYGGWNSNSDWKK